MNKYKALKVNGKKIDEHRFIIEQFLGRKLKRNEVVHHINGNKNDNRIENLQLMSLSEHSKLHNTNKKISTEQRKKLSEKSKGRPNSRRNIDDNTIKKMAKLRKQGLSFRAIDRYFNFSNKISSLILQKDTNYYEDKYYLVEKILGDVAKK